MFCKYAVYNGLHRLERIIYMQLRTGVMVVQHEGYVALMSGASATIARGMFYGGESSGSRNAYACCVWIPEIAVSQHCLVVTCLKLAVGTAQEGRVAVCL